MANESFVTLTANDVLQLWHLIMISALYSLLFDSLAKLNVLQESHALLLQIGHGYFMINFLPSWRSQQCEQDFKKIIR